MFRSKIARWVSIGVVGIGSVLGVGYWRYQKAVGDGISHTYQQKDSDIKTSKAGIVKDADGWIYPDGVNKDRNGNYLYDFSDPEEAYLAFIESQKNHDLDLFGQLVDKRYIVATTNYFLTRRERPIFINWEKARESNIDIECLKRIVDGELKNMRRHELEEALECLFDFGCNMMVERNSETLPRIDKYRILEWRDQAISESDLNEYNHMVEPELPEEHTLWEGLSRVSKIGEFHIEFKGKYRYDEEVSGKALITLGMMDDRWVCLNTKWPE